MEINIDDLVRKLRHVAPVENVLRHYMTFMWSVYRVFVVFSFLAFASIAAVPIGVVLSGDASVVTPFKIALFVVFAVLLLLGFGLLVYSFARGMCEIFLEYKNGILTSIFLILFVASSIFMAALLLVVGFRILPYGVEIAPFWLYFILSLVALVMLSVAVLRGVSGARSLGSDAAMLSKPGAKIAFFPQRRLRDLTVVPSSIDHLQKHQLRTRFLFGLGSSFIVVVIYNVMSLPVFAFKDVAEVLIHCGNTTGEASCIRGELALIGTLNLLLLCVVIPFCLYAGNWILSIAQRRVTLSLRALRESDERKPILFLRSFVDDQIPLQKAETSPAGKILQFGFAGESIDTLLLGLGSTRGPVVALGSPLDKMPPFGASRGYYDGISWQQAIISLVKESAAIVIVLDVTRAVLWEMQQIAASDSMHKTLFLLHPKFADAQPERRELLDQVSATLGPSRPELVQALSEHRSVLGFFWNRHHELKIAYSKSFSDEAVRIFMRLFFRTSIISSEPPVHKQARSEGVGLVGSRQVLSAVPETIRVTGGDSGSPR